MVINSFYDITNNYYLFKFKREAGIPDFSPIFNSGGDIIIWVSVEGIVISGRKLCGHVGNSIFVVGGTTVNAPLAVSRTMLCRWEDIIIYTPKTKTSRSLNKEDTITMYSGVSYSLRRGSEVVNGLIRASDRYRDQIMKKMGEGVGKSVLETLVSRGYYYKEGNDMFFLRKPAGSYFFKKMLSVTEFSKVSLKEKGNNRKEFNER